MIRAIGSERGNKGTATREVGWRIETAREENQMTTVIICEGREEKNGATGENTYVMGAGWVPITLDMKECRQCSGFGDWL